MGGMCSVCIYFQVPPSIATQNYLKQIRMKVDTTIEKNLHRGSQHGTIYEHCYTTAVG